MGWAERYELLVDRVQCSLRRPITPPEASSDLPELTAPETILVSVERFRLETNRAFHLTADMRVPLRRMVLRLERPLANRKMPRWVRAQIDREFADLARRIAVSGSRLADEFAQFYPADARLVPLHKPLVAMLDANRRAAFYAGAGLMYAARSDVEQSRRFGNRFREVLARGHQADLEFCEIVDDLGKKYPELMANFALDDNWMAGLRHQVRDQSRDRWFGKYMNLEPDESAPD